MTQHIDKKKIVTPKKPKRHNKKSFLKHLRNIQLLLFFMVSIIMFISMFFIINSITNTVSKDYAKLYADNAVGILNTYLNEEIALITKVAQSNAIVDWFKDEENPDKQKDAYEEIMSTINVSSSKHIYLGIQSSMNEYNIEGTDSFEDVAPLATLAPDFPKDSWFFECIESDKDYLLNVDVDKAFQRELVWLNCKVQRDGVVYGAVCVGLEFSQVLDELFSEYQNDDVRSLIINEFGAIQMDSDLTGSENFFYAIYDQKNIADEFTNEVFLNAVKEYTKEIDGFYSANAPTTVLILEDDVYEYATIAPIDSTTWSVVTLYNSSALFDITNLLPIIILIFIILILLIIATNSVIVRFFINPFKKLVVSIEAVSKNLNIPIYGIDREDEIGELANCVNQMKHNLIDVLNKVHFDSLTGIYNRRYLDEHLSEILKTLSLDNGKISILMVDIDHFKKFNDNYGHSVGDECLRAIANTLTKCLSKPDDFVARYGGEEFIIVLPKTNLKGACFIASKILKACRTMELPTSSALINESVTVSVGIKSGIVARNTTPLHYIDLADEALYISKQSGRNKYTVHI